MTEYIGIPATGGNESPGLSRNPPMRTKVIHRSDHALAKI
jgi:hypothetical protein